MSQINTQSTLATRLDEKKEREKQLLTQEIDLNGAKIPQNTPLNQSPQNAPLQDDFPQNLNSQGAKDSSNAPFKAFDNDEFNAYKQSLYEQQRQITQSDDLTPEQVEFAVNFSDESDELLKQGVSKKQMIEHLRKGDFLDKASWAMLDKQSGGNDDLIFDFFKQNADNLNPRKATAQKPKELKLYDTSEYEKELKTRGFLENTARNLAASFDEDFNSDKNEQNKIALNIKEKIKHGQNFNDLSDFEKDFLAYRGSLDEWQSVLSPLDSAQKTGKFYKPLTSAWNTLFKSDEQNAQDAFKNLQDELKNQNAYKQAFDKIQNGANFNDLSYDEKIAAAIYTNEKGREKEFYENMNPNAALLKEAYKDLKNTKFANVKSIDELSENEKKELYERQNVFSRAFAFSDESKNTLIQEELDEAKARKFKADFDLRKLGADLAVLEGFERKGLMTNAVANWAQGLFDKKGASEDKKKALQSYQNTMKAFGEAYNLDEIYADDKGRTHIVFEGQDFVIKDGGFQNFFKIMYESKFAVAGGVYGAIKGAKDSIKKGKISPKDVAYQSMKQSAIYSSVGGLGDYGVNIFKYDKDFDLRDALTYAVSEGVASVVGDAVVLGVGYGAKALYKGAKDGSLAQGARVVWQNTKKMADKISDNVVVAGFVKNLSNQNLRGAENLMAMNKDLKESINEAYERVGGRANVNETEFLQGAATSIKAKFGENSKEAKLAQGLCDTINLKSIKDRQKAMFEYIRADESGRSLAYLSEVANRSPQVQANLKTILNKTSYDLENKLKNLGIDEFDIKRVFDDFKNATGASYDEAMDGVLAKMYPSDIEKYRASVDLKGFEDLISHFENEKMLVDDASKIFKSDIVDALFGKANKDGTRGESPKLSFTQLNNIRKNLNAYTKRLIESRPSFQNTLSLKVQAQLRGAIDEAIKDIFRQNPTAFSKASELYTTALKDYAQMKDLMKTIDDLRVASGAVDEKQAVQAIVKYASGQGEENLANLTRLTQHLSDDNKAVLEMNILQDIFNKSFFADKEVDIKVFDSAAFLDKLATLTGKDGQKAIFQSKAAKEFLKMVDDFHTLFKKDADIARRISPARSNNPFGNSNFATTASGKLAMLRIKLLFEVAMRNMPDVFWLPANWTNAFKSAALKYHLEHALTRSNTISEFKTNFTHNVKRSQHTPQTQRLIKQITQGLDGLEKDAQELAKMSDDELTLRGIFGENYAEFKGKGQEAINHLLETKSGQVQGAFHRDDLGEINLVWGQVTDAKKHKGYGLAHIVDKHGEQAARQIPQIIKDGKLAKDTQGRLRIETQSHIVGINDTYGDEKIGHWIVTSYEKKGDGVSSSTSSPITTPKVQGENPLNEIIPNSNSQSQAPQKSLLEQARENTERLRAAQEAEQIAQKEAELARLKEMQAKNAEILAQKEAAAGQAINEAQSLEIGTPIKAQKISDTKIIINDNTAPFKAEFIIAKKDDIKPNFERTGTQGRSERQDKVIESIQSDFKPHLIFEQMGGFEGLPIILKDGQVIAGNHRAQAIKGLTGENLARYKQAAKEKFGVDLKDDEVIVRLVKDGDEKELINLAFMSNVGRESNLGEKALANLAKYDSQIQALPSRINAESVFELESQVAKALDTQGNGLNVFDTNLALFSRLAKSTQNANILDSLNALKNLSQDEKEKVLRMFVSNAGEFHNLAKDTQLKSLNLNDYLADALIIAAKNVDSTTRAANYAKLLDDIITMQASAKEMLKIDPFLFENFKSKALGYALARFARLENPSAKLFEFLKASKADLENLYTGNIFESNKAISDIDIYDFLKHAINSGEDLIDKQGRNIKGEITSRLDDLRKVENALIDSGEIQFAKSKAKPQGREAKETNINSLFADDELQMQATKPAKELNLSDEKDFNELGEFFALNSKDKEFNEIFAKATKAAQKLGVKVKFDESAARSHFILNDNTITIAAANKEHFQAQDLLHELIHATTRKALKDFNENPAKAAQTYTKRQIEAINEIISLYQKSKGIAKRQGKDAYALQNVDEFVAELSSGEFRAFLKAQDIFERFIKALIRFFTGDSERLAKNTNSYNALKESYYKILDDYEPPLAPQKIADERAFDRTFAIQKTARYVDDYAKTSDFKALDSDKQEAILRLKEIEPSPMPKDLKAKIDNENIITHFSKHLDSEERKFYYKLFDDAKEKPDFVLLSKDGETIEYIKAYEHTAQKDMYYLAFTQSDDNIKITGIPTTQLRKVVKDIAQSKKVVKAEDLGGILELRQADKIQSPQLADEIIPNSKGQSQGENLNQARDEIIKLEQSIFYEKREIERLKEMLQRYKDDERTLEHLEVSNKKLEQLMNKQKELSQKHNINLDNPYNLDTEQKIFIKKPIDYRQIPEFKEIKEKIKALQGKNAAQKRQELEQEFEKILKEKYNTSKEQIVAFQGLDKVKVRFLKELEKLGLDENTKPNIQTALKYDMKLDDSIKTEINNGFSLRENPYEKPLKALKAQIFLNNYPLEIKTLDFMYNNALTNLRQGYDDIHINYFTNSDESKKFIRKELQDLLNINPLKEFGTNYAEFYRDGQGAVKKLLAEKQGQVAGAFYRQELGDIDLVWGNDEIGLKKIIDKHLSDFADFKGDTAQDKLANALGEIVKDGKLINEKGVNTLYFSQGEKVYLVGLSEGFNGVGNNKWIITSYKVENIKPHIKEQIGSANKTLSADESLKEPQTFGSTADTNEIIPNSSSQSQGKANSMLESKKAYDSELKRLNNELEYTETLLGKINERGMIDKLNDLRDEILAKESLNLTDETSLRAKKDELHLKWGEIRAELKSIDRKILINQTKKRKAANEVDFKFTADISNNNITPALEKHPNDESVKKYLTAKKADDELNARKDELENQVRKILDELTKYTEKEHALQDIKTFKNHYAKFGVVDDEILFEKAYKDLPEAIRKSTTTERAKENLLNSISKMRDKIEKAFDITPLKEFGTNYAEFYRDGQGAVKKLLAEKQGQVAGAFYRDDLAKATGTGEIDLVWGDSTKGLQHILERRAADFEKQGLTKEQATQKALEFVENDLNEIIAKGNISFSKVMNRVFFDTDTQKAVIALDYDGKDRKWVLTAYFKGGDDTPRSAYPHKSEAHGDDFSTSSSAVSSNETLPQNELKSQADESQVLSAYDKNILENAPKETIEAHLKSIEKDIDYLEKGIDFYKKNPEQDYNGEMIKFNEKLLTPKLQMQKAYKQRLDELNSLDLSYAPKRNADEIQITLPKEKQTRFTMRQNAYKSLKEVEKTPLTNANDGRVAYLNKTGRQESLSDYAINESAKNGFDEAQHLATAQHLPKLFENAKFKETTRDLKNNDKNVKIHRYTANFLLDNEPAQAQITLKETIEGQHSGNKIYTLKLESVSRLSPAEPQNPREALSAINDPKSSGFGEPSTKPSKTLPQNTTKSQVDFTKRIKKVQNYTARINDEIGSGEFYNSLTREQKDKLYNAFLFKDKNLKNKGDFRIDDNYIYMNEKSTPEQISHALNVFLETEKIVDKSRPAFYETLKKYPKFNSKKVNDLLEFMKESDSFTKDKNGVPKEFFHGGGQNIKIFNNDESGYGYFFSSVKDEAKAYSHDNGGGFYKVFLQMKKPFRMDKITINSFDEYKNTLQNLGIKDITKDDYEIFLENKRFFNEIKQKAQENGFKLSEMDYSNATFINKNKAYNVKLYDDRTYPAISNLFKDIKPLNDGDIWFGFRNFARNEFDLALLSVDNKGIAEYNKIHAEFVGKLKDILQKQGYDSIIFNDFQVSVFNPNQIKEVKNAGSWTDSAGKITKEKPSDESARHSYFNPQSPNILHSNEIWGGGLAGGTLNGLETDEDGNIIGFNPAKFVAGFIAGAAGTKAVKLMLNSKAGQNHALKVATNISEDFKALRENNLPLFAKIMQKIEPQTLLKSSKEAKNLSNKVFNTELKDAITKAINKGNIENLSVLKNQVHFSNVSEFKAYFNEVKGNQGVIKTPYKDIKVDIRYAFNHFRINTYNTNRDNIKPAFFSTFKKPLFVVEFTPQGKTKPSTYFYKPFYDENKNLLNLVGISINERGQLKFFTFYLDERGNRLKEFLKRTDLTIRYVEPSE